MDNSRVDHVSQSRVHRLVLIDGNAILHRAYHALPPFTAPDGSLVNAVYGFTSMLLKLYHDLQPSHMAVAFDRAAPTFRKEIFKEYQAKRPKMEDELAGQIERVHEVVAAFHIPVYEMDGYEADDVIGTITEKVKGKRKKEKDIDQVIIVTGDRDMLQLVDDERVYVYMPTKGLSEAKLYGESEVAERLGVAPSQVVEYKALAGDPSDNYPGVEGIGPKTAAMLVEEFGSIEKLYQTISKVNQESGIRNYGKDNSVLTEALVEKLWKGEESARLSHELASIRTDVPIDVNVAAMRIATLDTPEVRQALMDLHFHSLLKRLGGESSAARAMGDKKEKPKNKKEKADSKQQPLF